MGSDPIGACLEKGYADLVAWACTLGDLEAFGIEGTGSYGVGLASFVRRQGLRVVEVNRCDRRKRRTTLKTLLVNAPSRVREALEPLTDRKLIDRYAALGPGDIIDPTASVKHALRALAARWRTLSAEIDQHDGCWTSSPGRQCRPCVRRSGLVPSPRPR